MREQDGCEDQEGNQGGLEMDEERMRREFIDGLKAEEREEPQEKGKRLPLQT